MAKKNVAANDETHAGWAVGSCYLVHTHLGIWLGRVAEYTMDAITIDACSWVADQGRMGACVRSGTIVASEFVGDGVIVPANAIKVPWRHALPTADK